MRFEIAERCDASNVSRFGYIGGDSNDCKVLNGWLTDDKVVQMKIFGEKSLNIWKKRHKTKDFYIKVTPIRANRSGEDSNGSLGDDSQSVDIMETRDKYQRWPIVEVAKLTSEDFLLRSQSQFGIFYEDNGFILFQAHVFDLPTVVRVTIYTIWPCLGDNDQ